MNDFYEFVNELEIEQSILGARQLFRSLPPNCTGPGGSTHIQLTV